MSSQGSDEQYRDGAEHGENAAELVRNRAQDRVERQEVPFRNDMRRGDQRVGRNVVVRVTHVVRREEHEASEDEQEDAQAESVLDREVRVERQAVLRTLDVDADRVVRAMHVNGGDVQEDDAQQHERQQVVQREEPVQRRVVDREAAPQPRHDVIADDRERGEQVGDDGGAPEAHLAPGKHVAHEGGRHHQKQDDDTQNPQISRGALYEPKYRPRKMWMNTAMKNIDAPFMWM